MKTRRSMSLSGAFLVAALLVLTPAGAGADAGPDLVLRPGSGPVGTTIEVFSPDQPATAEPGQRLAVWADCWRSGPEVAGGEQIWFSYYYLGVFTVTGTSPTTTGGPVEPAPAPVPAAPVPAAPTYTG